MFVAITLVTVQFSSVSHFTSSGVCLEATGFYVLNIIIPGEVRSIAAHILYLSTKWRWVVSFVPQSFCPSYLLDRWARIAQSV